MVEDNDADDVTVIDAREYTVKEMREWADDVDDQQLLNAMYRSELDNKQRKTALEALRRRGVELDGDEDEAEDNDDEPEDGTVVEHAGQPETVRVANQRVGSVAGRYFETRYEVVEMEKTPRVEEAINNGDLRVQHD